MTVSRLGVVTEQYIEQLVAVQDFFKGQGEGETFLFVDPTTMHYFINREHLSAEEIFFACGCKLRRVH